jgi:catechol 2,3-dioxygenase-like lactoylglutathione lyase family enzyme
MAAALKRVHQIAQHADDLDRAVAFYRDTLGLALIARFDPPGLAFFDLGNMRLLLEKAAASAVLSEFEPTADDCFLGAGKGHGERLYVFEGHHRPSRLRRESMGRASQNENLPTVDEVGHCHRNSIRAFVNSGQLR